eukprot:3640498-Rhodomonas_salina.3
MTIVVKGDGSYFDLTGNSKTSIEIEDVITVHIMVSSDASLCARCAVTHVLTARVGCVGLQEDDGSGQDNQRSTALTIAPHGTALKAHASLDARARSDAGSRWSADRARAMVCWQMVADVLALISEAPDDNTNSAGLDTDGYCLNGAVCFEIDRLAQRAHLEPTTALLQKCPFNPPRPQAG